MKHIPMILLFSLMAATLYSQPFGEAIPGYQIIKISYENSSGAQETTNFQYDKQNKIIRAKWSVDDNSRYSTNYYEYDSRGNLISAFRDFSDGITSFERFIYDESGNKVSEYFYRSDSISGYSLHVYDNKQLIQSDFFKHKGWLSGKLELEYNSRNKKEKGILLKGTDTIGTVTYLYDNTGNLFKETWDFNGSWGQSFKYTYRKTEPTPYFYSSPYLSGKSDLRISKEYNTFNNETGGPSNYFYNEQDLLIRKDFIRSDSLKTSTFYEYDSERKPVVSRRVYTDHRTEIYRYIYDENKNLIIRNCFKADTLYGFESYLYNSENVLIKAYLKNFDGWLNGTISFRSDGFGKLTTGEFIGENGFNASLGFHYNQEDLISGITWNFSFGKFQEYNFEYE